MKYKDLSNEDLSNLRKNPDGSLTVEKTGFKEFQKLREFVAENTGYWYRSDWDTIQAAKDLLNKK